MGLRWCGRPRPHRPAAQTPATRSLDRPANSSATGADSDTAGCGSANVVQDVPVRLSSRWCFSACGGTAPAATVYPACRTPQSEEKRDRLPDGYSRVRFLPV